MGGEQQAGIEVVRFDPGGRIVEVRTRAITILSPFQAETEALCTTLQWIEQLARQEVNVRCLIFCDSK